MPILIDPRLAEQDFGDLSALTWPEAKARFGAEARAWRYGRRPPPGGEALAALLLRVRAAAWEALGRSPGQVGDRCRGRRRA